MTPEMHGLLTIAVVFLGIASVLILSALILFARAVNLVWTANRRIAEADARQRSANAAYWAAHQSLAGVVARG
jgi:hypothetical protein